MRVTQNTNFNTVRDTIQTSKGRLENLQQKAATLKKINRPSDDPVASSKLLEVRTEKMNNSQYQSNARLAEAFLNSSDHVLEELSEIALRAKEIAIGQSSGASATAETRLSVAEEVAQLTKRAVGVANTKIGERFLFGGFKTDQPPVDPEGGYQGDTGEILVEIAKDVFLTINLPGSEAFTSKQRQAGQMRALASMNEADDAPVEPQRVNVFDELQNLRIALLTNNIDGVRGTLDRIEDVRDHLVSMRAKVGSRIAGLHSTIQTLDRQDLTNASLSSSLEDADMVEVMNNIAKEESVLRGVLSSSQRLVQPTLIDFLK